MNGVATDPFWPIVTIVFQICALVVVLIGWAVTHTSNNSRERRKEVLSAVNEVGEKIDALVEHASTYYEAAAGSDEGLRAETRLRILQHRLLQAVPQLASRDLDANLDEDLSQFIDALTGGDFESADRMPRKPNDAVILKVGIAAEKLRTSLQAAFYERYK